MAKAAFEILAESSLFCSKIFFQHLIEKSDPERSSILLIPYVKSRKFCSVT